jgi:hypothetical protein
MGVAAWFEQHQWLANWIAGVGQALGAGFTFWAVLVALKQAGRAEKQRAQDVADQRRARARLVTAHAEQLGVTQGNEDPRIVHIRNDGDASIRKL